MTASPRHPLPPFSFPASDSTSSPPSPSSSLSSSSSTSRESTASSASSLPSSPSLPTFFKRQHRRSQASLCTPSPPTQHQRHRQTMFRPTGPACGRHSHRQLDLQSLPPVPPLPTDTSCLPKPVLARPTPRPVRLRPAPLVGLPRPDLSAGTFLLDDSSPATPTLAAAAAPSPLLQPSGAASVSDDSASTCPTLLSDHHPHHAQLAGDGLECCDCADAEAEDDDDDGEFWACIGAEAQEAEARKRNARLAVAEWVQACGVGHPVPGERGLEVVEGGWVRAVY